MHVCDLIADKSEAKTEEKNNTKRKRKGHTETQNNRNRIKTPQTNEHFILCWVVAFGSCVKIFRKGAMHRLDAIKWCDG